MKKLSFKSIRGRLLFWFLILALVPLLAGILTTYNQQRQSIEKDTFTKLIAIRELKVQQLEDWIEERKGDVQVMAGDYEIRALEVIIEKNEKSEQDIIKIEIARELLNRNHRNYDDYNEIFIVGKDGLVEISSNSGSVGIDKSREIYFTTPLKSGEMFINEIYYSKSLNQPQMTFSIPIYGLQHNDQIIGILVVRMDLENSLYQLLANRTGLGKTGETLIINEDIVALNQLRYYDNAPLNLHIHADPAIKAARGETGIIITKDYRGEDVLAAYTYIPETAWGFVCKQDMSELNEPILNLIRSSAILLMVSVIMIMIIVFWIVKRILKPIVDISIATQKIKSGDYSVRTFASTNDELASLSDSINEMTVSIESRIATQKGVGDISDTIIAHSSIQEFATGLLKQLMKITKAHMSVFYILNEVSSEYEFFTSVGANKALMKPFNEENLEGEFGNALSQKSIYYLKDIPEDTVFSYRTTAGDAIPKEIITIPILVDESAVAFISLVSIRNFEKECHEILEQSWAAINTSYSSLMAGERTRILAEQLSLINQQLEAQSEELQDQAEEMQDQAEELQRTSQELQEQNLELDAQKNQVEAANKMKSEFLSNMSHELRTPLNSIMALSQVLIKQAKGKLNEEENSYLEIVVRNGKNLLSLINNILDLSKIEAGKMEILPVSFSIESLLHIIKDNMQALSERKGLTLSLKIPDKLKKVETDESKLHQVVLNIVSNAVKFTEKGGVEIQVKQDDEYVYIDVEDSGIGIAEDMLPHIFDEFRQADGTTSRLYEGTGLGLAIANKTINMLGGNIAVKSRLGEGSVFTIKIPIKWPEILQTDETISGIGKVYKSLDKPMGLKSPHGKFDKNTKGLKILYVEDNKDARVQIKAILSKEGYVVEMVANGQKALDYLKHSIPDGIILDLNMPVMDGFEMLETIRSTKETKNIPVLVLTAKDLTHDDLSRLSSNNIQQLIIKGDVDIEGLLLKIKLMLGIDQEAETEDVSNKPVKQKRKENPVSGKGEMPTVLIVEDNPDNMITIKAILQDNYKITEAINGADGLEKALSQIPDLILLDISLPHIDGEEIVQILKTSNETKNIPIIAVTAQAMKGDKEKLLSIGCDAYVSKPIDPEALLDEIRRILK